MRQPTVEVFHYIPTRHRVSNGCRDSLTRQLWHQLTVVLFHDIPKCQCVLTNFMIIMRRIGVRQ